ncbi:hypothetical protein K439DRAFT_1359073, partial [Ramaria rubella]
ERMCLRWNAPIYVFYDPVPAIESLKRRKCHALKCAAKGCRHVIRWFIGMADAQSTGNMRKHVKKCWGEDVLDVADQAENQAEAHEKVVSDYMKNGSIMAAFQRSGKGRVSYSHRQHMKAETKWSLMKTGRLGYYLPSPATVAWDVKLLANNDPQDYDGELNFATNTWTSPNHRVYVGVMVHFKQQGIPISILLDIVEVAEVHTNAYLLFGFNSGVRHTWASIWLKVLQKSWRNLALRIR